MNSPTPIVERGGGEAAPASVSAAPAAADIIPVRALLLGERLDTRSLEREARRGAAPLTLDIPGGGTAVLFRYGAVVLFGAPSAALEAFLAALSPQVVGAFPAPERDEARLAIRPESDQHLDASGNIILRDASTERLQLVADILAKSLVLSHYETRMADIFDRIEPLAATLREKGRAGASGKVLLRHIGDVLLMQQKMVGRVETAETPSSCGSTPSWSGSICGWPTSTSCATATGHWTASSTSSRARSRPCSAWCRPAAACASSGTLCC